MSSKRRVRRKQCTGKVGHETIDDAWDMLKKTQAANHKNGRHGTMHVYRCKYCGKYHIGHQARQRESSR